MALPHTNDTLITTTNDQHFHSHVGPSDHCGTCAPTRCNFPRLMKGIALAHLLLAVFFFVDNLAHMFYFPYQANDVPIRVATALLVVLNLLLAALAFGAVRGQAKNAGKSSSYYNYYMGFNIAAAMLVCFLFLLGAIETIYMLAARMHTFWGAGPFVTGATTAPAVDGRTLANVQLSYAQHPLWAQAACHTILLFVFFGHMLYGMAACKAKHQHPATYQQLAKH